MMALYVVNRDVEKGRVEEALDLKKDIPFSRESFGWRVVDTIAVLTYTLAECAVVNVDRKRDI